MDGDAIVVYFRFGESLILLPRDLKAIDESVDWLGRIVGVRDASEVEDLVDERDGRILIVCRLQILPGLVRIPFLGDTPEDGLETLWMSRRRA